MTPTKRITDPTFRYVNAANTDLRRTFARIRAQLRAQTTAKVQPIKRKAQA